jgi:uncharacterized protein (DUF924 family)
MNSWEDVTRFWIDEVGPKGWFEGGAELDAEIRRRFEADWHEAMAGRREGWRAGPRRTLAYLILTDQFPRNMFRGTAQAFASDGRARAAAYAAIAQGWDLRTDEDKRQFFYLPLSHSESLSDQDRAVRLTQLRMPAFADYLLHARAHRDVIRQFGRFPFRNAALGRATSPEEGAFLEGGGYGAAVEAAKAAV